jgi:tetratricopeptide (TPR) repeat protein
MTNALAGRCMTRFFRPVIAAVALISLASLVGGLAGCAAPAAAPPASTMVWHDALFDYSPTRVTITQEELFALEPALIEKLSDPALKKLSNARKLEAMMSLLYGQEMRRFDYAAGHSTTARQTWVNRRGDCLSLTVLAYAMGRQLDLLPDMQEVKVPPLIDRRGNVDYYNHHVNVLFRRSGPTQTLEGRLSATDMVLDFEPQVGSHLRGQFLTDAGILARFYNNLAAEFLAKDQRPQAYAHFKAAIAADAKYAPSYTNLATLYRSAGLLADAERLLRQSIAMSDVPDVPLHLLQQHLEAQGREQEAQAIQTQLQYRRTQDPYYWAALGLQHLREAQFSRAIEALERAQAFSSGFEEVHRLLAVAYWRDGQRARADQQLSLMAQHNIDPDGVLALRKKFRVPAQ